MSDMDTTTTTSQEAAMTTTTFSISVPFAQSLADAQQRCRIRLTEGVHLTGRVDWRDEGKAMATVEAVAEEGANVADCWVVLTSYGLSPSKDLGACWQGVGLD